MRSLLGFWGHIVFSDAKDAIMRVRKNTPVINGFIF
jgi:hypothetical protein